MILLENVLVPTLFQVSDAFCEMPSAYFHQIIVPPLTGPIPMGPQRDTDLFTDIRKSSLPWSMGQCSACTVTELKQKSMRTRNHKPEVDLELVWPVVEGYAQHEGPFGWARCWRDSHGIWGQSRCWWSSHRQFGGHLRITEVQMLVLLVYLR